MTRDDFDYAIENTHVIVAPERQIATFGSTSFNFYLDLGVDGSRRSGPDSQWENPRGASANSHAGTLLPAVAWKDSEKKRSVTSDQLREHARNIAVLRYGFQFRKTDAKRTDAPRFNRHSDQSHQTPGRERKANRSAQSFTVWMTPGKCAC